MSWVLFFDGDCVFCSASVRWVARFDKWRRISFEPLKGELAGNLGLAGHAAETSGTMVLLRESDGVVFTRSDALLELARALGWPWHLARVAVIIPLRWRDGVYQFIADRRGRLGARVCDLPANGMRKRGS